MAITTATYGEIEAQNKPSLYATPLAWATAKFARLVIADERIEPRHTGMIVVSDECSLRSIRELSVSAARGTVSPLRFAGASPSIVAGLPALQCGIRGPTLCLTMPPHHASGAVLALINYWLSSSNAASVIAIAHYRCDERRQLFKGFIARQWSEDVRQHVMQVCRLT